MRSGRSFLLLLVVAAGLGGYIYFVEMKRDPAADKVVLYPAGQVCATKGLSLFRQVDAETGIEPARQP